MPTKNHLHMTPQINTENAPTKNTQLEGNPATLWNPSLFIQKPHNSLRLRLLPSVWSPLYLQTMQQTIQQIQSPADRVRRTVRRPCIAKRACGGRQPQARDRILDPSYFGKSSFTQCISLNRTSPHQPSRTLPNDATEKIPYCICEILHINPPSKWAKCRSHFENGDCSVVFSPPRKTSEGRRREKNRSFGQRKTTLRYKLPHKRTTQEQFPRSQTLWVQEGKPIPLGCHNNQTGGLEPWMPVRAVRCRLGPKGVCEGEGRPAPHMMRSLRTWKLLMSEEVYIFIQNIVCSFLEKFIYTQSKPKRRHKNWKPELKPIQHPILFRRFATRQIKIQWKFHLLIWRLFPTAVFDTKWVKMIACDVIFAPLSVGGKSTNYLLFPINSREKNGIFLI